MKELIAFVTSPKFFTSAGVIVVALAVWFAVKTLYNKTFNKEEHGKKFDRKKSVAHMLMHGIKIVILVITVLTVLQIYGINVSSLVASLGLVGIIAGLALQDFLKDCIMGVHIVTDGFFAVGDVVKYKDIEGVVIAFNVKTTKIRDVYNENVITVSNRNISEITVVSKINVIDVPLSYGDGIAKIEDVLVKTCERIEKLKNVEKCTYKGPQRFDSSAIAYRIVLLCSPIYKADICRNARAEIIRSLAENGLEIPFDQLDVHTK